MRHMLIRHVSGPTYANTAVAAGLFLGTLCLLYRQSILVALGWTANLQLMCVSQTHDACISCWMKRQPNAEMHPEM